MGTMALDGPDAIEFHAQLARDPAGEEHLALSTGRAALGGHAINSLLVYKCTHLDETYGLARHLLIPERAERHSGRDNAGEQGEFH
jgi:hypothetical protein